MIKKLFAVTLLIFTTWFIISSCKKSDTNNSSNGSLTTSSPATPQSNGDPGGTYSGFFIEVNDSYNSVRAAFYTTPISLHLSATTMSVPTGTVSAVFCNNVKLFFNSTQLYYKDTTANLVYPPAAWEITGNNAFPTFTYTCNTPLPTYNNGINLPSVINRNQNLVISTGGASDYDQIVISIADTVGYSTTNMAAPAGVTSITCIKDTLTKLTPAHQGSISVSLYKYNSQTINGKNYLFITNTNYFKDSVLIK